MLIIIPGNFKIYFIGMNLLYIYIYISKLNRFILLLKLKKFIKSFDGENNKKISQKN